jgi:hypothetical protein
VVIRGRQVVGALRPHQFSDLFDCHLCSPNLKLCPAESSAITAVLAFFEK